MKGIYITLTLLSVIVVTMIALAFFYLDQQQHQTFLYGLYYDDVLVGYEKLDKYRLENRWIYKSFAELPRDILNQKTTRKIAFDMRGKNLIDYKEEVLNNGAKSTVYIRNTSEEISFMATGDANFSYLDKVLSRGNDLPFENGAIVTYPPLIRRYNFKKRGEQFINVLTPVSTFLPPTHQTISIISTGKDTIEIEGRKINCERLILKLKNGDFILVWVSRGFHNVIMVDMPKHRFKAIFSTEKKNIPVEEYKRKSDLYTEKEITFTNEGIALYGTLSTPTMGEAPYPAVISIWNSGPMDRSALGMFTDIAHTLAEAGFCVLRFDKRGVGQSQGFSLTYDQSEEISDLKCAVDFLKSLPDVDKSRIALLGHSEGGFYAAYLASVDEDIRACIIMSALSSLSPLENDCNKSRKFIKSTLSNDEEYLESAITAITQSREMIKDKSDWITVLDNRVFTKKINFEDKYSVLDTVKKVKVPVLILHGNKDNINLAEEAKELGDALAEAGNDNFTIIHFGELNHFFGTVVSKPPIKDHIEVDLEALKSISAWLDKNLFKEPVRPPLEAAPSDKEIRPYESQEISSEESIEKSPPGAPTEYPFGVSTLETAEEGGGLLSIESDEGAQKEQD